MMESAAIITSTAPRGEVPDPRVVDEWVRHELAAGVPKNEMHRAGGVLVRQPD